MNSRPLTPYGSVYGGSIKMIDASFYNFRE